jgi:hypothetical protein
MLQRCGNFEIAEHQHEDEHVVERKRPLDDISGEKLHPDLIPNGRAELPKCIFVQAKTEQQSQRRPDRSPGRRLTKSNHVRFAMKQTEIESQEHNDQASEGCVEPPVVKEGKKMLGHLLIPNRSFDGH